MGNALRALRDSAQIEAIARALEERADDPSALVREHVRWALSQRSTHAIE
jgi:epoxyqueuosine reductase